jgi:phage terminase large subunit
VDISALTPDSVASFVAGLSEREKAELDAHLGDRLELQRNLSRLRELRAWSPRSYQQPLWDYLQGGGRRACLIWHRRSGKDSVALNWASESMLRRVGEYWHMLPEASQGRKAVWSAVNPHTGRRLIDQAFPLEFRASTRDQEMAITYKNGSLYRVVGSDNYDSLVGSTPAGVVLSEWALADPNAWAFIRPILMENKGWAMFITTPRGNNHAKKTRDLAMNDPEWFGQTLTVKDTKVFSEDDLGRELREMQHEYGMDEGRSFFDQEYYCSFESALLGSYYGASLTRMRAEGRITSVPVDKGNLVHTGWDLGASDSTGIWFVQVAGREYRFVDYYEAAGPTDLAYYAQVLEDKKKQHGWIYGTHYLPHDVAHMQQGNPDGNRVNTLKRLGITAKVVEVGNKNDGINAFRRILDAAYIDEKRCERGLDALSSYCRLWDQKLKMFRDEPHHNWASHGADAGRTFACGYRHPKDKQSSGKIPDFRNVVRPALGTGWMRH